MKKTTLAAIVLASTAVLAVAVVAVTHAPQRSLAGAQRFETIALASLDLRDESRLMTALAAHESAKSHLANLVYRVTYPSKRIVSELPALAPLDIEYLITPKNAVLTFSFPEAGCENPAPVLEAFTKVGQVHREYSTAIKMSAYSIQSGQTKVVARLQNETCLTTFTITQTK